ncbi:MAG: TonB-dependent receptor [Spirochaetaceae bacterium]|nr:TonB-dependent receptor [Spirochaetaceae bacterium]
MAFLLVVMPLVAREASSSPPDGDDDGVIMLPEAAIVEERDNPNVVTQQEMERDGANDLWEAVRYVPGVILSGGGRRNDSNFTVRGFGADDVPIFIDGILMANPYRGEGDAARFLTGDLESVEIQKGFSTELLGANVLGGAVLMRTSKPKKALELSSSAALEADGVFKFSGANLFAGAGTRQDLFYAKANIQYRLIDHWRLSDSFEPVQVNPQQKGDRLWSDSKDVKTGVMLGLTPAAPLDIWLSYTYQNADKGVSPPDIRTREFSIWHWPVWNRHSVSLNGAFESNDISLNVLIYFDKYDNRMDEYYNLRAYELGFHAPHSDYDEYSAGGRITGSWSINALNKISAAFTYKKEDHKGLKGDLFNEDILTEVVHVNEDTWSLGTEYENTMLENFIFKAGFGFDALIPNQFWSEDNEFSKLIEQGWFVVKTRRMFLYTALLGAYYDINADNQLHLTYARKNHFPTMSARYSTRFGKNLPNPNLGPEMANHFEFGYTGTWFKKFSINAALYYSLMEGKFVNVKLPNPDYPSAQVDYARNLDAVSFYGFELAPEFFPAEYLSGGISFSVNEYFLNKTQNAGIKRIPYYPEITFSMYAVVTPVSHPPEKFSFLKSLSLIPRIEYISMRYSDSGGLFTMDSYWLLNLKLRAEITGYVTLSFSVDNVFDSFYEIRYNSPMPGRSFTTTVAAKY